jgi:transportin-3
MIFSYRTAMAPLLPTLANKLVAGFAASRQGSFLWATDAIVREFAEGKDGVDKASADAVFHFFEQQATTFLRALNDLPPEELPDGKQLHKNCVLLF